MRSLGASTWRTALLLLLIPFVNTTSVTPITLSYFQQISGFSQACSKAYNTPLVQCTDNDFAPGRACSMRCVQQLEEVSAMINTKCKGTKAYPDTLIGMFFTKSGVSTLCPNVIDSGGVSGGSSGTQSPQSATATATSRTTQTVAQITQTRASSTSQTTLQPLTTTTVSSDSPASASTSSSPTQAAQPTLNSGATLTQSRLTAFGSRTVQAASTSTSTGAKGSATAAQDRGGNRGGSGGTPFDISASTSNVAHISWVVSSIICVWCAMRYA